MSSSSKRLHIRYLGLQNYHAVWEAMRLKNKEQNWESDEFWLTEHPSVYTLGSQGGLENMRIKNPAIPIIETDRGGNITYHGPGQLVIYPLMQVRLHTNSIKTLMDTLEECLTHWIKPSIPEIYTIGDQRGLYVKEKKIASMGLRIANGRTYHGISVNVDMDLAAFDNINPCGYPDLRMTQWVEHASFPKTWFQALEQAVGHTFGYTSITREYHDARTTHSEITWPRQTCENSY